MRKILSLTIVLIMGTIGVKAEIVCTDTGTGTTICEDTDTGTETVVIEI
jgi:hypothetical protein